MAKDFENVESTEEQDTNPTESSNSAINSFVSEMYCPVKNSEANSVPASGITSGAKTIDSVNTLNSEDKIINLGDFKEDPLKSQLEGLFDRYLPGEKVKVDDKIKDLSTKEMAESMTKNGKMDAATENTLARAQRDGKLEETVKALNDELRKSGSPYHLQVNRDSHEWHDPHKMHIQPYPVPRSNPDGRTTTVSVALHDREKVKDETIVSRHVDVYSHRYEFGRPYKLDEIRSRKF